MTEPEHRNEPASESNSAKSSQGASLTDLLMTLGNHGAELLALFGGLWERHIRAKEAESEYSVRMTVIAAGMVVFVVATAAALTYVDKIDGSTFTFLLGLIVGYVLTFIRDAIKPPPAT